MNIKKRKKQLQQQQSKMLLMYKRTECQPSQFSVDLQQYNREQCKKHIIVYLSHNMLTKSKFYILELGANLKYQEVCK